MWFWFLFLSICLNPISLNGFYILNVPDYIFFASVIFVESVFYITKLNLLIDCALAFVQVFQMHPHSLENISIYFYSGQLQCSDIGNQIMVLGKLSLAFAYT